MPIIELNDILVSILIMLIAWVGHRLHSKIDALEKTVHEMAIKNAEDHGEVQSELRELRTRVDAIPSPWKARKGNADF